MEVRTMSESVLQDPRSSICTVSSAFRSDSLRWLRLAGCVRKRTGERARARIRCDRRPASMAVRRLLMSAGIGALTFATTSSEARAAGEVEARCLDWSTGFEPVGANSPIWALATFDDGSGT